MRFSTGHTQLQSFYILVLNVGAVWGLDNKFTGAMGIPGKPATNHVFCALHSLVVQVVYV